MSLVTLFCSLLLLLPEAPAPWHYVLEKVVPRVEVVRGQAKTAATAGEALLPGDELRTGWRGRATVVVAERAARFEIAPSTHVRLQEEVPGALIVLQRGALRALFDALLGHEERLVATPGALLAVRGTRFAVQVDPGGEAVLAVFAGAVEVRPRDAALPPVGVGPGELCHFGPRRAPTRRPFPPSFSEEGWERHREMRAAPAAAPAPSHPSKTTPGGPRAAGRGRG